MIEEILDEGHLDNILETYENKPLVIFQHCMESVASLEAYATVKAFMEKNPAADCLLIDATDRKSLVSYLEEKSGFPFTCPQILYYINGKFVGRLTDESLTIEELEKAYHALT